MSLHIFLNYQHVLNISCFFFSSTRIWRIVISFIPGSLPTYKWIGFGGIGKWLSRSGVSSREKTTSEQSMIYGRSLTARFTHTLHAKRLLRNAAMASISQSHLESNELIPNHGQGLMVGESPGGDGIKHHEITSSEMSPTTMMRMSPGRDTIWVVSAHQMLFLRMTPTKCLIAELRKMKPNQTSVV